MSKELVIFSMVGAVIMFAILLFALALTIENNLTIVTLTNWKYLGEGKPNLVIDSPDCYGIGQSVEYRIGECKLNRNDLYTPIPYWLGYQTTDYSHLNFHNVYSLYSKQRWFKTDYLIICK